MRLKKAATLLITGGVLLIFSTAIWLATAGPVSAQCGSQASSCKNCHETQGQDPVNTDGTAWHSQHSFGDFCYLCHGGNNQAMDRAAAHTGLAAPLSDINASCKSCHPADMLEKAQIYATTLGVVVGTSGSPALPQTDTTTSTATPDPVPADSVALPVNSTDLVNYVQQYDQTVLGQKPTNWGNVIAMMIILIILVGGGGVILLNEKLVRMRFKVSFGDTRKAPTGPTPEYPADVVDMLPKLSALSSSSRRSLGDILEKPQKTNQVLRLIRAIVIDENETGDEDGSENEAVVNDKD